MSYADTQLATGFAPIMQAHWGALKEGATHALFSSSTQGVDVVPVAKNFEMEELATNPWQSSLRYEGITNISCIQILPAEGYSHLPEARPILGHLIPRAHGQTSQSVHAYLDGTLDIIDIISTAGIRTTNVIECAYKNCLVDNVSATSLIDHLKGLVFVTAAINSSRSLISTILERFEFRNRDEVIRFIGRYEFLIPLLLESQEKVRAEFGNRVNLILQVVRDPESNHDDELFLIIKTGLSPEEALESLERLDKNWWVDASSATQCKLNIDYELA